jgi:hypothetical protein
MRIVAYGIKASTPFYRNLSDRLGLLEPLISYSICKNQSCLHNTRKFLYHAVTSLGNYIFGGKET